MITPFKENGSVDYETAKKYVDWYFENGINGIFAICQSSEIFFLSLEERVKLNEVVYKRAKELSAASGRKFTVVSSGHVSDTIEDQIKELRAVWESGTDALIMITNRLDVNNEGDDVFISNCKKIIEALPEDVKLGLYECPYPYKRLVTPKILDFCLSTGKFFYMKDTCCDTEELSRRIAQLRGSDFKLLNANCQTLLYSMQQGGDGYCGIMCNYHPYLYAWLGDNYNDEEYAPFVQSVLGTFGFTESGLPYPISAKYHMNLCGIKTEVTSRSKAGVTLSEYERHCIREMKISTDRLEKFLRKR
jgi:4-hydroxy-tetrahydrodipicolinate synthase